MEKIKTYIYGASGHGKVILDILEAQGTIINGFIDDDPSKNVFEGFSVKRRLQVNISRDKLIFGIGDNHIRKLVASRDSFALITAVHPSAVISSHAYVGEGTAIMQLAVIQSGAVIGRHCIVNTGASIDHDCKLGDFVHVAPGAVLCGNVKIGELSWIGAGSTIIQNITVGKNVNVGAGAVIIEEIPDNAVVIGNPGKIIRYQI